MSNYLFSEAKSKWLRGYSQSRLVDFVHSHTADDKEATRILNQIFKNA